MQKSQRPHIIAEHQRYKKQTKQTKKIIKIIHLNKDALANVFAPDKPHPWGLALN